MRCTKFGLNKGTTIYIRAHRVPYNGNERKAEAKLGPGIIIACCYGRVHAG